MWQEVQFSNQSAIDREFDAVPMCGSFPTVKRFGLFLSLNLRYYPQGLQGHPPHLPHSNYFTF